MEERCKEVGRGEEEEGMGGEGMEVGRDVKVDPLLSPFLVLLSSSVLKVIGRFLLRSQLQIKRAKCFLEEKRFRVVEPWVLIATLWSYGLASPSQRPFC